MKTMKVAGALLGLLSAFGCGGDDSSESTAGASGAAGMTGGSSGTSGGAAGVGGDPGELEYSTCAIEARAGLFSIELAARFTGINGSVRNGVDPLFVPEKVASEGECTLYRTVTSFCDPSCGSGESCSPDGCIPTPRTVSVGNVTVTGLVTSPIEIEPRTTRFTYTNPDMLPHPGFDEGAEIALSAAGGEQSAFMLRGVGVAAVEVPAEPVMVMSGQPAMVTWTAPSIENDAVRMVLNLDIARHGGTPARIECDVPDTGSFAVPEALVTQLVNLGFSGFPAIDLVRRSADSVEVEGLGCVELEVKAKGRIDAALPGLTSCSSTEGCEDGQTCQMDMTCSE